MTRAVVDPGVLISALISTRRSAPGRVVRAWSEGDFELVASPKLLSELAVVLARMKFSRQAAAGRAEAYVAAIAAGALVLEDPADPPPATPDPGDDYLVALARSGRADVIVSGDRHLTGRQDFRPPVLTPRRFIARLAAEDAGRGSLAADVAGEKKRTS